MHKGAYSDGPARMARTPGGGTKHGCHCHGKTGERGMGSRYSGGKNTSDTLSWKNPKVTRVSRGKPYDKKRPADRWEHISHNPSGAAYWPGYPDPYPEKT